MKITQADLLPNENVILSKNANAIIKLTDYGLSQFAFDKYMWAVGMKGKEAIGGRVHLTNYRLIFKSHKLNRLKGKFSIFLPTIRTVRNSSFLISRKVTVGTGLSNFDFVIWGIPAFIKELNAAQDKLTTDEIKKLKIDILNNYEKCGEGLQIFGGLETLNKIFLRGAKVQQLSELATNPFEAIGAMALEELFDQTVASPWQKNFE